MTDGASAILDASILIVDDQQPNVSLLEQLLGEAGYTCVASTHESEGGLRTPSQEPLRPHPARPADAGHGWLPGDGSPQDERCGWLPSGHRADRPAGTQAAGIAGGRQGFHQQAVRPARGQDAHPQHARGPAVVQDSSRTTTRRWNRRCGSGRRNCAKARRGIAASPSSPPTGTGSRTRRGTSPRCPVRSSKCWASGWTPSRRERATRRRPGGTTPSGPSSRRRSPTGSRSWISCSAASMPTARGNSSR